MLDEGWIRDHAAEFDVYHLHFGFDQTPPETLQRIADTLHELGKPLVYTVHDLRNPHQVDPAAQDAALDVLVPAADALITLTPGAARAVERRWGRSAEVIPHPHVLPLDMWQPRGPADRVPTVGLSFKSMRANMNPLPVALVLVERAARGDIRLVLDAHTDVVTPGQRHHDAEVAAMLSDARESPGTRVEVHGVYSDEQLWAHLRGLDLSVLPYRFGTHSGWLELCHDLGTRVLAPRTGYYHEQHPGVLAFEWEESGTPRVKDVDAALAAVAGSAPWQASAQERTTQRRRIAAAHAEVYRIATATLSARAGGGA